MQKLSILLPAYNADRYIAQAIKSILSQSYCNFELLIADDGSNDGTRKIIESFEDVRIRLFYNKYNIGKVKTCNYLVRESKGYYITIHDADDWSEHIRFERQIKFLEKKDFAMCGCDFYQYNGQKRKVIAMPTDYNEIISMLPLSSQFHGPTIIFRREILSHIGGLYRDFTWGEDIDFTARVVEKYKASNISIPLYHYRIHGKSLTNDLKLLTKDRFINAELRLYLAKQREENGKDCLMLGGGAEFARVKEQMIKESAISDQEIYYKFSHRLMYLGLFRQSILAAFFACRSNYSYRNIKNFIYMTYKFFIRNNGQ